MKKSSAKPRNGIAAETRGLAPPSAAVPVPLPGPSSMAQADGYLCIAPDVKLGHNVKFSKFINLYGCEVGDETKIGAFVEIQKNAKVGIGAKYRATRSSVKE